MTPRPAYAIQTTLIASCMFLGAVGAGCSLAPPDVPTTTAPVAQTAPAVQQPTNATTTQADQTATLTIETPIVGTLLTVKSLSSPSPTFLFITTDDKGKPGELIAKSKQYPAGITENIILPLVLEKGKTYWIRVMSGRDAKEFDFNQDKPVLSANGQPLYIKVQPTEKTK